MYMVVSYNSISCMNQKANVKINGIYSSIEEAHERQKNICGGSLVPNLCNSNCMEGINGTITWIKNLSIGDLDNVDIYSPRP